MAGLLCEEEVLEVDNVKYCGYCKYHFSKMVSLVHRAVRGSVSPAFERAQALGQAGAGCWEDRDGWSPGPAMRSFATG